LPISSNSHEELGNKTNRFLYQGKEWQTSLALNLYDFHARQYDPATGRFTGVDPKADIMPYMGTYAGMMNNPTFYTDPDGECPICPFLIAAAWGAGIGGAAYTASVAFSDGGFDNWNWGGFAKAVGIGAVSGVATAGIGKAFGSLGGSASTFGGQVVNEVGRAATHGLSNTAINGAFGNNVSASSFAIGAVSSLGGTAFQAGGGKFAQSGFGVTSFSALSGGITAEITGGDFWRGAATGATVGLLNHAGQIVDRNSFYRNALDGMKLPDGTTLSKDDFKLSFLRKRAFLKKYPNATYGNANYLEFKNGVHNINFSPTPNYEVTIGNIRATGLHEAYGHGIKNWTDANGLHHEAYWAVIDNRQYWNATTTAWRENAAYGMWAAWTRIGNYGRMHERYMWVIDEYY